MLQWDSNLSVGFGIIDKQHQELFSRINALLLSMKEGKGKSEIDRTLKFLEDYTLMHFAEEEKLQQKSNYPKYEQQKAQHDEFRKQLAQLKFKYETNGLSSALIIETQKTMSTWWTNHITKLDKDLGQHLGSQVK